MKSKSLFILILFFLSLSLSAEELPTVDYFSIADTAGPLQIFDGESFTGIVTDVLREILEDRAEIRFHNIPIVRMKRYMLVRRFPNWITYGTPGWRDSPQSWRLSEVPVFTAENVLVSRRGEVVPAPAHFAGRTVVLIEGFDYPGLEPYLEDGTIRILRVHNYKAALRAIRLGRGDCFPGMGLRVQYTMKQEGLTPGDFEISSFEEILPDYGIYLSFSLEFPDDLYDSINRELEELRRDGYVDQVIARYTR